MHKKVKLRYGDFKFYQSMHIVLYSSIACKIQNSKNNFKIVVHHRLFVV